MISVPEVTADEAGYPIVAWMETRSIFAPGGPGVARVECRITKDAEGQLLFTARGAVRHGSFEEGKPLAGLTGFSRHPAESLYYSPAGLHGRAAAAGKSQAAQAALKDHGQVILAEFGGDEPMHVNYAEASGVELERLEVELVRAFGNHRKLTARLSKALDRWPVGGDRVVTSDPTRRGWPERSLLREIVAWGMALTLLAAFGLGLIWIAGFVPQWR